MLHIVSMAILSSSESLYRFVLFLYPTTHRNYYGEPMIQLFCDLCQDSYRRKGLIGILQLWFWVLQDVVISAAVEHLQELKKGHQLMTKKQHSTVILFTGFPLILWLILLPLNPNFTKRMFVASSAQPAGWIMIASILVLSGAAYIAQRTGFKIANSSDTLNWAVDKTEIKKVLFICSIVLFVFPAIFLVLFGPAIMLVMESGF
jgi:hypothetical protein